MPELTGTVKKMSPSGKGFQLNEYENWFNKGRGYQGPWPFAPGTPLTVTYEQTFDADGTAKFWVLGAAPPGQPAAPPAPTEASPELTPTNGPTPVQEVAPPPVGPTPVPLSRENSILFQVCLKAAQEWVLAVEVLANTPAEVLNVADIYYAVGLKLISGEAEPEQPA